MRLDEVAGTVELEPVLVEQCLIPYLRSIISCATCVTRVPVTASDPNGKQDVPGALRADSMIVASFGGIRSELATIMELIGDTLSGMRWG
jgi:hypothetical protein